ncbi:MAG: hydrogenase formation protein HypD [Nitrospirae bacterium CG18_big_fil_WC_8_21_14_2_50_70_55]|nr:hydrogenase formation protein HypD [Deltaproteobacteria bacterium]OIP63372.1 MAG: hydrogenase formation protein HypD [Nitrospirae bacterium CG2_30_70_394]PIQ05390.1 MAG: hydrogenase formation protein HypD [Nitrospirae bacterium CG18_big_fil_WC_8_21_14_2_50_70_55]PIU80047.1 MAG: hydrogenase formation protein HypD [Nitrospirae bacterium CG06_land_8_20_14_3_00_70_43]PIW83511.1 MAG: hydrogenase formation protein HypD [Nitrospirae bacterium CG_4_8_14_3_um_filter_70_85]PIX84298.1 MAG: hydrogenase
MTAGAAWLARLRALDLPARVRIMNVCGGHERAIAQAGLRTVLPPTIELIPGPGCPVCVCPEEAIYHAIHLALDEGVVLVAFGDMLRVPVNVAKGEARSLEEARGLGGDVRPIASPAEARTIARAEPARTVVFFAAGFETTTAPVAALVAEGLPDNLLLLTACRRTWPAVALLLESGEAGFDGLVAPGHVATVMGPEEWSFIADRFRIPVAVAGFTADSLLAAFDSVVRQHLAGQPHLTNCYPRVVRPGGNRAAQRLLAETFDVVDAPWRGIGTLPASGYRLKARYAGHDAALRFPGVTEEARARAGEMPAGCGCASVVLGRLYPTGCALYGQPCTPRTPVGPCMVSDEGACRIWWASGNRGGERVAKASSRSD